MNKFLNNLKRKFTAPKTRDMPKKIESMEDYLGPAKAEFKKMQEEAEFYKDKQEALSKAQRDLKSGDKLFTNYIAEIEYKTTSDLGSTVETSSQELPQPSSAASIFLYGVRTYPCTTLQNDEYYENETKRLKNDFSKDSMGFDTALAAPNPSLTNRHSKIVYSPDECLEVLKKYEKFCRTCKQKIKDIFEEKMKKFSKEKTALKELSDLIKKFNLSKKFDEIITAWQSVSDWYDKKYSTLIDKEQNPVTQVYTKALDIAKEKVPKAIGQHIKTEFTGICEALKKINRLYTQRSDIPNSTLTAINQSKDLFNSQIDEYKELCSELGNEEMVKTLEDYKEKINNQALVVTYAIGQQDTKDKDK